MKYFLLLLLILYLAFPVKSQVLDSFDTECTLDSLYFAQMVTNLEKVKYHSYRFSSIFPGRELIDDFDIAYSDKLFDTNYCSLLMYAEIFNSLFERGLDLEFDYVGNPTRRVNAMIVTAKGEAGDRERKAYEEFMQELKALRVKHMLFNQFLTIKKLYERVVIKKYYPNKENIHFISWVEHLVKEGDYCNPSLLRAILISDYDYLTGRALRQSHNCFWD